MSELHDISADGASFDAAAHKNITPAAPQKKTVLAREGEPVISAPASPAPRPSTGAAHPAPPLGTAQEIAMKILIRFDGDNRACYAFLDEITEAVNDGLKARMRNRKV